MKKLFFLMVVLTVFLAGCSIVNDSSEDFGAMITSLDELFYDWGDISIEGGDVDQGFHFRNDGDEPLLLTGATTSCMCTTAYFELADGSMSPEFGMHDNEAWTYSVEPGEEFELEVIFDPMAHGPDGVGPIQRLVTFFSDAGDTDITVSANILYDDSYQEQYGGSDFAFEETEYDFGVLKQSGGISSYEFPFTYVGEESITVTAVPTSCACTTAEISQNTFESGEEGVVTVYFDPNLHEEPEGRFFKTVSLLTDPELEKQPELKIWAEIDLDLGEDAYKLKEEHVD